MSVKYKLRRRHLNTFRRHVLRYMALFGVTGWQTEFHLGKVEEGMACVQVLQRRVDITLAEEWEDEEPTEDRLRAKAKHETFHIFLAPFSQLANKRYATKDELYDAEEELVEMLLHITEAF
jgi:hypothetical protein